MFAKVKSEKVLLNDAISTPTVILPLKSSIPKAVTIAWNVHISCKASHKLSDLSGEVLALQKELEIIVRALAAWELFPSDVDRLEARIRACLIVLEDMQALVKRYEGIGRGYLDELNAVHADISKLRVCTELLSIFRKSWE